MKKLLFIALMVFSTTAFADDSVQIGQRINADMVVHYYTNLMPGIVGEMPEDNRVFFAKVTVEFCRKVSADEFVIVDTDLHAGTVLQLYSRADVIMDCKGPLKKQTFSLRLDDSIEKDRPFLTTNLLKVVNDGEVH